MDWLRSWFLHAAGALAAQVALGAPLAGAGVPWSLWATGAGAVGFLVGVEWMQQVRVNLAGEGRPWPSRLSLGDVLAGFAWSNLDRYGDVLPAAALCAWVASRW